MTSWAPGSLRRSGFFFGSVVVVARISFYIDGFNMYHALQEGFPSYKWLNYRKLAEQFIRAQDTVGRVAYFTALALWKPEITTRHEIYIKALRTANVDIVRGRFGRVQRRCHLCNRLYWTHQEKRTDVNIALQVLTDAVKDLYDRAVIISADSDLIPAFEAIHETAPDKEIGVILPIGRSNHALIHEADFRHRMRQRHLKASQFPPTISLDRTTIIKPSAW